MEIYGFFSPLQCQLWKCSQWAIKVGRHRRCYVAADEEDKAWIEPTRESLSQKHSLGLLLLFGKSQTSG